MTEEQFDNTQWSADDKIVVRKYFGTECMTVQRIDLSNRTVNGYYATEIIELKKNMDKAVDFLRGLPHSATSPAPSACPSAK